MFPNPEVLLRLAGAVLVEAHDEWQATDRRYLGETTMALLTNASADEKVATPELIDMASTAQRANTTCPEPEVSPRPRSTRR